MGIKKLKDKFKIEHQICINNGDICIGSAYISDIIRISSTGKVIKRYGEEKYWDRNKDLLRYQAEIDAAIQTGEFLRLFQAADDFDNLIPVFTHDDSMVIKKYCETFGYPNTTTDGEKMYDNTFFKTEKEARQSLLKDTKLGVKYGFRTWKEKCKDFAEFNTFFLREIWCFIKARIYRNIKEVK